MKYVYAQVSFSFYAKGTPEEIKEVLEQGLNLACAHVERSLPHENIGYRVIQFKTDEE